MTNDMYLYGNFGKRRAQPLKPLPYRQSQSFSTEVELPRCLKPWRIYKIKGKTIASNPDHAPMIIVRGKAKPMEE